MNMIKTRFAPSPTGYLHIGGLRTALFNYLWAKKNNGQFLLRIEDTDQTRLVEGAKDNLIKILKKMNLNFDNTPIIQSERLDIYKIAIDKLISEDKAYYCFCSSERLDKLRAEQQANKQMPRYDEHCRDLSTDEAKQKIEAGEKYVVRFKIPSNTIVKVEDLVYGKISVKSEDLDDLVLLKSDGFPTYHLANIVDDHEMEITHVIRGEEWLPSLPKHALLYDAFGWKKPNFAHLPLLLNPDKSKLSKRQGDVAVEDFLTKGYTPEALLNYIALLGWNPGDDREMFSLSELEKEFDLAKVNKAGAIFDQVKLNWFNAEYIRQAIKEKNSGYKNILAQAKNLVPDTYDVAKVLQVASSRLNNLNELKETTSFYYDLPDYKAEMLIFKKSDKEKTILGLNLALEIFNTTTDKNWQEENLNKTLQQTMKDKDLSPGDVFWPIRVALSGLDKSPSPAEIMWVLGKEESLKRIKLAVDKLK
ncbi:glutamate--tRNA ligase [bacterium]|nr:glutamate--tRNA ligase [bacterium]